MPILRFQQQDEYSKVAIKASKKFRYCGFSKTLLLSDVIERCHRTLMKGAKFNLYEDENEKLTFPDA